MPGARGPGHPVDLGVAADADAAAPIAALMTELGVEFMSQRALDLLEKAVADAGVILGSDALEGIETATTVQVTDGGERVVTDGPFAETRELLAGAWTSIDPGTR